MSINALRLSRDLNAMGYNINNVSNIDAKGNITTSGYFYGQPLDGSIGSGVIWASDIDSEANIQITDNGGLSVTYPDMIVRVVTTANQVVICNITSATVTVPDNAHTVYYVSSDCSVQNAPFTTYIETDLSPGGLTDIFNVYTHEGDIGVLDGITVKNKETIKTRKQNFYTEHLKITSGMAINNEAFPNISQTSGRYFFIRTLVDASAINSSIGNSTHYIYHKSGNWNSTIIYGLNLTHCDDGTDLVECPSNLYRRYVVYTLGFQDAEDHTQLHQLAPLTTENTYPTLAGCIDTEKNPISYTLPSRDEYVAVTNYIYCGKRDDTDWRDGWIDIRVGLYGFGAVPDLSIFLTTDGSRAMEGNLDIADYNITNTTSLTMGDGGICWNGTGIIITGNFSKYCG